MIIVIKNAITNGTIGTATNTIEARKIAERSFQPYKYEVKIIK